MRKLGWTGIGVGMALAATLLARPAGAQVTVLDQLPVSGVASAFSQLDDSDCTFGDPHRSGTIAEDFILTQPVQIDTIRFQSMYVGEPEPSNPETFLIRFLTNTGSDLPGTQIAAPTATITQSQIPPTGQGVTWLDVTATFASVSLNPGTYWLEIVETDTSTDRCHSWMNYAPDPVAGRPSFAIDFANIPGSSWSLQTPSSAPFGVAVRISGQAQASVAEIPTLDTTGLALLALLLGAGACWVLRRRARA